MEKPIYLLPFIFVYKTVIFVLSFPFKFLKFFFVGFFITFFIAIDIVVTSIYYFVKLFTMGFTYASYYLYRFIKYIVHDIFHKNKKNIVEEPKEPLEIKEEQSVSIEMPPLIEPIVFEQPIAPQESIAETITQPIVSIESELEKINLEKPKKEKPIKIKPAKPIKIKKEHKPISIMPILKLPFIGFVFTSYIIFHLIRYITLGFAVISRLLYRFIRYTFLGIYAPFYYLFKWLNIVNQYNNKLREKQAAEAERRALARERNRQIQEENKKRLAEIKIKEKEVFDKKKEEQKLEKDTVKEKKKADIYINENVTIEKKKLSDHLNDFFAILGKIPSKIKAKFSNNHFAKDARNKKDINREALLLDFDGEDAEKSAEKVMYKYVAKDADGKIVTGYFPAYSKVEVHSFLLSEGNEVYSIETNKWIQQLYGNGSSWNKKKIKTKDLIFFTTQLSTYVKAGIPLVEALKILSNQFKDKTYARIFRSMIYDLTMGDNFSDAMNKQGNAFPRLLINMVKASEMTGELPEALDDMADYFTETDKTRKQMVTAMAYPAIIFIVAIAAVVFIMVYVVPQFVGVYEGIDGATLPGITVFVLNLSNFLQNSYLWLILGVTIFVIIFIYLYKNVKSFKTFIQWLLMHLPVIGNVIIYNEVTMFTKTFASLLAHNVFITESMEILNKITNNEIYHMLILDTITNLAKGEKISLAFKDHWAFPVPAYEMIRTGERTGQLPEMMGKVSVYYQDLHRNAVTRIKTFVEPALIIFLTVVVGGIVLSIVIPMFDVYSAIQV